MSWLFDLASDQDPDSLEPELVAALSHYAENMLVAGVCLTVDNWTALGDVGRAAFVVAGKRLNVSQALRTGRASQNSLLAAAVEAEIDDGENLEQQIIETAVLQVAAEKDDARR